MDRENVSHRLAHVVVDAAPEADRVNDGAEVIIEEHDRCSLARHVGSPPAHRDADVRRLERRRVIDAVSGHRDDLAIGLERIDDAQLLIR